MNTWILLASAVTAVLAVYAAWLAARLFQQGRQRKKRLAELEQQKQQTQQHCRISIRIISNALLSDNQEITLTEAAMRISVLSTQLEPEELEQGNYLVFNQLAAATAHIPILDEWKKLKKGEKLKFDKERQEIEQQYRELAFAAARVLGRDGKHQPLFYSA